MNKYTEFASKSYNRNNFNVENGHIKACKVLWCREDVIHQAKDMNIVLTEDEIDKVMYCLVIKHNAETGINWETIKYWIEEVVREENE